MGIFECPKCGRCYNEETICPYCKDTICKNAKQSELVKELEAELEQHRWIPVSERLPENDGKFVLVTNGKAYALSWYNDRWSLISSNTSELADKNITYWKPIILS
jgi:hypothetical protein